jgi:hypothetical protein
VVRAGTSNSGLHNKPAGCGAAEAYASGTDSEEEEEESKARMWRHVAHMKWMRNIHF